MNVFHYVLIITILIVILVNHVKKHHLAKIVNYVLIIFHGMELIVFSVLQQIIKLHVQRIVKIIYGSIIHVYFAQI